MDEAKKGYIALQIFRQRLRKEGIPGSEAFYRELGNTAKAIGVSKEDFANFATEEFHIFLYEMAVTSGADVQQGMKREQG